MFLTSLMFLPTTDKHLKSSYGQAQLPLFFTLVFFLFSLGCSHTKCERGYRMDSSAREKRELPPQGNDLGLPFHQKVTIYKPDGSLQCNQGKRISLETMAQELSGIKIYSQKNLNDGQMRIQVCGSPTGNSNVYEISKDNFEEALRKGFLQWTFAY
jgi:hypothetical protein